MTVLSVDKLDVSKG